MKRFFRQKNKTLRNVSLNTLTILVKREPVKAGIDTLNKLIDRHPDDNTVSVEIE